MTSIRNLEKLSLPELQEHLKEVQAAIVAVEDREREALREKVRELSQRSGISLDDLFGSRRGKGKGAKSSRKGHAYPPPEFLYKDKDPNNKPWTGRGKRPRWLIEKLEKGAKLDQFKVPA